MLNWDEFHEDDTATAEVPEPKKAPEPEIAKASFAAP